MPRIRKVYFIYISLVFLETPHKFMIAKLLICKLKPWSVLIISDYYFISTDEDHSLCIESFAIVNLDLKIEKFSTINLGGVSTKLSLYCCCHHC